jgi:hypothetical protein
LKLKREHKLKLKIENDIGIAFEPEQKAAMLTEAKKMRSRAIHVALWISLDTGFRDGETKRIQLWRLDLEKGILTVGKSKSEAGRGRTIPRNADVQPRAGRSALWSASSCGSGDLQASVVEVGSQRNSFRCDHTTKGHQGERISIYNRSSDPTLFCRRLSSIPLNGHASRSSDEGAPCD